MVMRFVIWEAQSDFIPFEKAASYSLDDFENALVNSEDRAEIARFCYRSDAESYLMGESGSIIENSDKSVYVDGFFMEACYADKDGQLHKADDSISFAGGAQKACRLTDRRSAVDYFDEDAAPSYNEDYCFRMEHRPRSSLKERNCFDKRFANFLLNKETLSIDDRKNLAAVISDLVYQYEELTDLSVRYESYLSDAIGKDAIEKANRSFLFAQENLAFEEQEDQDESC